MKLSKVAAFAEIIGALAIIVSLIFVGSQIKENTKATKSATSNSIHSEISEWYLIIGSNGESSSILMNYMINPDSLNREEKYQGMLIIHSLMLKLQDSYYLSQQGTLDEHIRSSVTSALLAVKDTPGMELYWSQRKPMFLSGFQNYVDQLVTSEVEVSGDIYK